MFNKILTLSMIMLAVGNAAYLRGTQNPGNLTVPSILNSTGKVPIMSNSTAMVPYKVFKFGPTTCPNRYSDPWYAFKGIPKRPLRTNTTAPRAAPAAAAASTK